MIIDKFLFKKHLEKGEEILYAVHKHHILMLKSALEVLFFGFAIPWGLYFIGLNTNIFFWLAVVWSMLAAARFLYVLTGWYSRAWLITDISVILIEWNGIFSNNATRIGYEDVEGASYEIKGFWGTILRYGDMQLRAMSGSHIDLSDVARPKRAELTLLKVQSEFLHDRNMEDTTNLKTLLSKIVAYHNKTEE